MNTFTPTTSHALPNAFLGSRKDLLRLLTISLDRDTTISISKCLKDRRIIELTSLTAREQCELLVSRSSLIWQRDELQKLLEVSKRSEVPLRIKFGIDPTTPTAHIGHAVPIVIASRLQRMGHHIVFIIGDVTAKIGDPSGRNNERPPLSNEDVARNFATYKAQFSPFFDFSRAEFRFNSEWLEKLGSIELLRILGKIPLSMQLQREDFRNRLSSGSGISTAELLYSVFMAFDSVAIKADIELGGIDQLLNLQMCRKVMEVEGMPPEVVIMNSLIEGTDGSGAKMSKSKNNFIGLNEDPHDIFGKVMSVPDRLLETYFKALTELSDEEWVVLKGRMENGSLNPMAVKKLLAFHLLDVIASSECALNALHHFEAKFSQRDLSALQNLPELRISDRRTIDILRDELHFAPSASEARRLAKAGAIRLISEVDKKEIRLSEEQILQPLSSLLSSEAVKGSHLFLKVGRNIARVRGEE